MKNDYLGHTVTSLLNALYALKKEPLSYLETGTMRHEVLEKDEPSDARSTLAAARWLRHHGGSGVSIDNYAPHVELSRRVLLREELTTVAVLEGVAPSLIPQLGGEYDFVLLDSASCPHVTWEEFKTVITYLRKPALIVIDDIGRNGINKGELVLKNTVLNWKMVARHVAAIPFGSDADTLLRNWVADYKVRGGLA